MAEWVDAMSLESIRGKVEEYLAGLIGIPMIFDGNSLCPDCLKFAMDIYGGTWFCKACGARFPATVLVDKWGSRWLRLNDLSGS